MPLSFTIPVLRTFSVNFFSGFHFLVDKSKQNASSFSFGSPQPNRTARSDLKSKTVSRYTHLRSYQKVQHTLFIDGTLLKTKRGFFANSSDSIRRRTVQAVQLFK